MADSRGGGSLVLRVLLGSLALLALVGALVVLLVHVEQVIMLSSPAVRDAQARLSVADLPDSREPTWPGKRRGLELTTEVAPESNYRFA